MLELCMLGTGGALPLPDRGLSACYLRVKGKGVLIDCGEGTQTAIRKLGWGFRCIDGMIITHYHGDHCGGLPGFLLSLGKAERREPFHIWGGTGLSAVVNGLRVVAPVLPFPVVLHEFHGPEVEFELIGLHFHGFRLDHGVPCYGWQIDLPRKPVFHPERAEALGVPMADWKRLQAGESVGGVNPAQVMGEPRPLELVEWFILNEIEGADITGKTQPEEMLDELLRRYPACHVVLTLGERGSVYADATQRMDQSIVSAHTVDTTAAGDTFTGYFIHALLQGEAIQQALKTAACASAITVSRPGAGRSIPAAEEVQAAMKEAQ